MDDQTANRDHGPWAPGLNSKIPRDILPFSTMFRPEMITINYDQAHELSDFSGLSPFEVVPFRAERLIIHELLIQVTADFSIPDGADYEVLGINLRAMAATILEKYIGPEIGALKQGHQQLKDRAAEFIHQELSGYLSAGARPAPPPETRKSLLGRLFGRSANPPVKPVLVDEFQRQSDAINGWRARCADRGDHFETACLEALIKVVNAIVGHRGRLVGEPETIAGLAATLVGNTYGSQQLGAAIEPIVARAAAQENYRFLPAQSAPVVMNVKGASAAGKSTIRPQQRKLAEELGIPWQDFALISPDYWRKFLLEYESLGEKYKYGAMLTGHELEIIDKKFDRYMADKADKGLMSHMLIDRFRFDSFVVEADQSIDSTLLTRFGERIFMFFMITPPEATVERAWNRGLTTGRYKAVDDLLHHNVEAYTGMPQLFFSWASVTMKRVHYEFLDNSVPKGSLPRTVAFGWSEAMTILDVKCMLDIERNKKIDIDATRPEGVYLADQMAPHLNTAFLEQCAERIPVINFADYHTGQVYARLERGKWAWRDAVRAASALEDPEVRAGLEAIGWEDAGDDSVQITEPENLLKEKAYTLGVWGLEKG